MPLEYTGKREVHNALHINITTMILDKHTRWIISNAANMLANISLKRSRNNQHNYLECAWNAPIVIDLSFLVSYYLPISQLHTYITYTKKFRTATYITFIDLSVPSIGSKIDDTIGDEPGSISLIGMRNLQVYSRTTKARRFGSAWTGVRSFTLLLHSRAWIVPFIRISDMFWLTNNVWKWTFFLLKHQIRTGRNGSFLLF